VASCLERRGLLLEVERLIDTHVTQEQELAHARDPDPGIVIDVGAHDHATDVGGGPGLETDGGQDLGRETTDADVPDLEIGNVDGAQGRESEEGLDLEKERDQGQGVSGRARRGRDPATEIESGVKENALNLGSGNVLGQRNVKKKGRKRMEIIKSVETMTRRRPALKPRKRQKRKSWNRRRRGQKMKIMGETIWIFPILPNRKKIKDSLLLLELILIDSCSPSVSSLLTVTTATTICIVDTYATTQNHQSSPLQRRKDP